MRLREFDLRATRARARALACQVKKGKVGIDLIITSMPKTSALLRRLLFAMKNSQKSPQLLKATFDTDSFRCPASKPILDTLTLFFSKISASPTNAFSKTRGGGKKLF